MFRANIGRISYNHVGGINPGRFQQKVSFANPPLRKLRSNVSSDMILYEDCIHEQSGRLDGYWVDIESNNAIGEFDNWISVSKSGRDEATN